MESFDSAFSKAISKYSSTGQNYLDLNLTEQILISTEIDISKNYPDMENDPQYHDTLSYIKTLPGYPY